MSKNIFRINDLVMVRNYFYCRIKKIYNKDDSFNEIEAKQGDEGILVNVYVLTSISGDYYYNDESSVITGLKISEVSVVDIDNEIHKVELEKEKMDEKIEFFKRNRSKSDKLDIIIKEILK